MLKTSGAGAPNSLDATGGSDIEWIDLTIGTPYYSTLGLKVRVQGQKSMVILPASDKILNSQGAVHGGAIAALLDVALSQAVRALGPPGVRVVTIDLHVTFLRPGRGRLDAHGKVLRAGKTVALAEALVTDSDGTEVAKATGALRTYR